MLKSSSVFELLLTITWKSKIILHNILSTVVDSVLIHISIFPKNVIKCPMG